MTPPSQLYVITQLYIQTLHHTLGVLVTRSKKDANDNIHPASVSIIFAPEGATAIRAVCKAERALLPPSQQIVVTAAVTTQDGGTALREERLKVNPTAPTQQCAWHYRLRMKRAHSSKLEQGLYEKLLAIPKGQVGALVTSICRI